MPSFIADPPPALYLILIAIAIAAGAVAARYQDRPRLIRLGLALAALLLLYGLDRGFESPREEAVRRVQAMARAADEKHPDAFVEHVADTIEYRGSADRPTRLTKQELRTSPFWDMLRQFNIHVAVWDFSRDDMKPIDDDTIEIGFSAKGEVDGKPIPLYIRATFRRQADGSWKLAAFASFKFEKHDEPFPIPNLGR